VPFTGLNSFFDGHVDRAATLAMLRNRMQQIEADQLVLMVTHQVVISAITGIAPRSGGIIAYNSRTGSARRITLP
ncbi:MAG: histidine phosphatase family protein, partial [Alphaproteobacteria bacterium]|nr:histidine phosphatase family protein [Alphaproteobacteria bacterium]